MELKGSVVISADGTSTTGSAISVAFQLANAAGRNAIDLTPGKTLIKYSDQTQSKMFATDSSTNGFTSTGHGSTDSGMLLERNEIYEIKLTGLDSVDSGNDNLTNLLGVNTTFSLEVIPPSGAVLFIERTTPVSRNLTVSLD